MQTSLRRIVGRPFLRRPQPVTGMDTLHKLLKWVRHGVAIDGASASDRACAITCSWPEAFVAN